MEETISGTTSYRLYDVRIFEWCTFSNGVKTRTDKHVMYAIDPNDRNKTCMVTIEDTPTTITSPNTTIKIGSSDNILSPSDYTFYNNASISVYCIKPANSISILSGTVTLLAEGEDGHGCMNMRTRSFDD